MPFLWTLPDLVLEVGAETPFSSTAAEKQQLNLIALGNKYFQNNNVLYSTVNFDTF